MSVIKLTKENFVDEVMQAGNPVLIDFYADWCGPCKMLAPTIDALARTRDDIKVCKVNVDEEGELANEYGIVSIPTLMVVENGEIVKRSLGAKPKKAILDLL